MAIRFPAVAKQILCRSVIKLQEAAPSSSNIPRGCCAVYVGEGQKKRYVIPISYLNQPLFQNSLNKAEKEFGFEHPTGGLTIPCREDIFIKLTSASVDCKVRLIPSCRIRDEKSLHIFSYPVTY